MLQLDVEYVSWECMLFYEVHINQIERIQRLRMTDMHGLSRFSICALTFLETLGSRRFGSFVMFIFCLVR
jgi:hypothetical protein